MKRLSIYLFALLLSATAVAQGDPRLRKIDSLLTHFTKHNKFMGALTIREKDRVVFEKAYGFADVATNAKANAGTRYKIGSITKMFTSAIVFQLIEEKKLTLDTKLSKFCPQIKNADKITIGQMLQHKSGIHNYTNDDDFPTLLKSHQSKEAMLAKLAGMPVDFEPGARAEYSNSNYLLLGYIIEDITKKPYKDNIADRIVKKVGLKDTYYFTGIDPKKNEAYSYVFEGDKWVQQAEWDESVAAAAGALQSTPTDLTKFIKALFDGKIISKSSLTEMTTLDNGYGKGILQFPFGERRFLGHNGGIESFSSTVGYYANEGMSFSLIQNGDNYETNEILIGVLSIYYKMPYQFPNLKTVTVNVSILKSYEGTYASPGVPLKIIIKEEGGKLIAQATGQSPFPLNATSNTEFNFDPAGINLIFKKDAFTLKQGGMSMEFTKEK